MPASIKINLVIFILITNLSFLAGQENKVRNLGNSKKYSKEAAIDPIYGIIMYNKLIGIIGGDSTRFLQPNLLAQDWIEDYYTSGKLLHKGFYVDGKIRVFRNFYEEGTVERIFKINGSKGSELTVFYPDGKVKSYVKYLKDVIVQQKDFFSSGVTEYEEESSKDGEILWKRISYFSDGSVENSLEVTEKRKKLFRQKEFYSPNRIKIDGEIKFNKATGDYVRDGLWNYYDENGKLAKTEKYYNGQIDNN